MSHFKKCLSNDSISGFKNTIFEPDSDGDKFNYVCGEFTIRSNDPSVQIFKLLVDTMDTDTYYNTTIEKIKNINITDEEIDFIVEFCNYKKNTLPETALCELFDMDGKKPFVTLKQTYINEFSEIFNYLPEDLKKKYAKQIKQNITDVEYNIFKKALKYLYEVKPQKIMKDLFNPNKNSINYYDNIISYDLNNKFHCYLLEFTYHEKNKLLRLATQYSDNN